MNMIKKLFIKYKELIVYVVFGACTTLVNFAAFKLFNVILGEKLYLLSNIIAWFLSVVFAYVTNKLWVFESKSWEKRLVIKEVIAFFSARVFSFLVEEAGLFVAVDLLKFSEKSLTVFGITIGGTMIAKVILAVIVVTMNYFFSKLVIFKKKQK
ncbi:MAG: GtrA family protein [Oscillospiraceae bacterium]|nr:GtrA family protein [Oscillospiraceae bacterium]